MTKIRKFFKGQASKAVEDVNKFYNAIDELTKESPPEYEEITVFKLKVETNTTLDEYSNNETNEHFIEFAKWFGLFKRPTCMIKFNGGFKIYERGNIKSVSVYESKELIEKVS